MSRIDRLQTSDAGVTVRVAAPADAAAVAALAAVDSSPAPSGPVLVAEVGGRLAAAMPLEGGGPVADPFLRTDALVEMLDLRVAQLRRARERRGSRLPVARRGRATARAAA